MLKIKDDVDLKVLEDYGFVLEEDYDGWSGLGFGEFYKRNHRHYTIIGIDLDTKEIRSNFDDCRSLRNDELERCLDDLIQAGLVEKVELI